MVASSTVLVGMREQSKTNSASTRSRVAARSAPSIFSGPLITRDCRCTFRTRAAASESLHSESLTGVPGGHLRTATRDTLGKASFRSSSRFPATSGEILVNPVTFPPGRARLATSPWVTASPEPVITMAMVLVAFFAASAAVPVDVTMMSTLRRTNSSARAASRSARFSQYRRSTTMF